MLFLVTTETFDSIVGDKVPRLREQVGIAIKRIEASGKMRAGGILGGKRGAFFLLEMTDAKETLELLGGEVLDNMHVQLQPIVDFKDIAEFFARDAANV